MRNPPPSRRFCPICDRSMDARVCPTDQVSTLLLESREANAATVAPGEVIGERYLIEERLAGNAATAVFRAKHRGTGRDVALKLLSMTGGKGDTIALQRLFLEARTCSALRNPHTVRVFDFGQDDGGLAYLAMELLSGRTLREELRDRTFTEKEAIELALAVTRSLGEAHAAGLVHRDLKPENIFLHRLEDDETVVKVLDFGAVKLIDAPERLTAAARVIGTPSYMSPEQVLRERLDGRSDLFALGVVLFELVSGTRPFDAADPVETARRRLDVERPSIRAHARTPISEAFAAVIDRALARFPEARFADAREMRNALAACSSAPPPKPRARDDTRATSVYTMTEGTIDYDPEETEEQQWS